MKQKIINRFFGCCWQAMQITETGGDDEAQKNTLD